MNTPIFTQYEDYLMHVMQYGRTKTDRTGTGTIAVFGRQMRWNLQHGFPLVTTKKLFTRGIIEENLWFLRGSTDNNELVERNVHIWDEWARENGDLGPIYGKQWRSWPGKPFLSFGTNGVETVNQDGIDQIQILLDTLRKSPDSRRMIVNAWNVADLPDMALTPCHCLFQFYTETATMWERVTYARVNKIEGISFDPGDDATSQLDAANVPKLRLSCQLYQRSCDSFLGVPFNIASYAMLTHMIAQQVDMIEGDFIWTGGDCHIYSNHFDQVREQLSREIRPQPTLKLKKAPSLFEYKTEDFVFEDYDPHPAIKGEVSV
jgi:thymidylate synthase